MPSSRPVAATCCLALVLGTASAHAEPPDEHGGAAERAAFAEALFVKAKALMADRRFDEACPMLAESQRIDPGGGTMLTLALCHERQGKTATAWAELEDARARAVKDGEADREALAKEHIAALEPKLTRLTVRIASAAAATPGLSIRLDGLALERPAWGVAVPVDPGPHRVEAGAPGKRAWAVDVRVGTDGGTVVADVTALADEAVIAARAERRSIAPAPPRGVQARTVIGFSLLGAGAASLGVGAGYGVVAISKQSEAYARCPTSSCADATARRENAAARSAAVVADVAVPIGLAAAGAGVIVLVTGRRDPSPRNHPATALRLGVTPGGAMACVGRAF